MGGVDWTTVLTSSPDPTQMCPIPKHTTYHLDRQPPSPLTKQTAKYMLHIYLCYI